MGLRSPLRANAADDDVGLIMDAKRASSCCARGGAFSTSAKGIRAGIANAIEVARRAGVNLGTTTLRKQTWRTPSPSSRCVSQHTREWLAKRKKVVKRTLTEAKRTQLRELFAALDSDGGGEVEFEEFASAWKMMAGDREESATIARKAFKEIDADGNGTMDFEEFSRLMLDLEEGTGAMMSAANDPTCGAMLARSARSLRTRKLVDDFIETFSKNNDTYDAWLKENDEEMRRGIVEEDDENDEKDANTNTARGIPETNPRKPSFHHHPTAAESSEETLAQRKSSIHERRKSSIHIARRELSRKMSLADMCAPADLLRKIRDNREHERRKTQHQLEVLEQIEKVKRETVKVNMLDQELHEMDELLMKVKHR